MKFHKIAVPAVALTPEQQQRRDAQLAEAKARLGTRYLLHPANKVQKNPQPLILERGFA